MTGPDRDDRQPAAGAHQAGAYPGAPQERPNGCDYTCHTCGFTRYAAAPPEYCPRCHAETHPESS
jgi:rubrerythrin